MSNTSNIEVSDFLSLGYQLSVASDFQKVMIKKGETKKLTFTLTKKDFEIFNQNMEKCTLTNVKFGSKIL